jgi:hypothetical protein
MELGTKNDIVGESQQQFFPGLTVSHQMSKF